MNELKGSGAFLYRWILYAVLISSTVSFVVPDLIATFNMDGVNGTVSFAIFADDIVQIKLDLAGFPNSNSYKWTIHNTAMLYDRQNPCEDSYVGAVHPHGNLTAMHGELQDANFTDTFNNTQLKLDGPMAVDGRTLVFESVTSGARVCAQLVADAELITAIAIIDTPFAGQVIFRQPRDKSSGVTTIYIDVYDVVDPLETTEYSWYIADNTGLNHDMIQAEQCQSTLVQIYNPTSVVQGICNAGDHSTCSIGDLNGKLGAITVKPVSSKTPNFFVDTNLPLTTSNSIIGKTLVFSTKLGVRSVCVQIRELQPKTVGVKFSVNGVSGSMKFSQKSPFDPTVITADIRNLRQLAGGYHVHKFPVPLKMYMDDQLSSPNSVAGHFNPYGKNTQDPSYPASGAGTNDQYEVGDISGKFGTLADIDDLSATYKDWNLPLFGKNSIVGRSVIIHKAINAERWIYGTIGYPSKEVNTVQAIFTSPIVGKIVLRQPINDPLGDTSVWVEVAYADGSSSTADHNWHIHQTRVANDYLSADGRCSSTAGHFNPFDVDVGNLYGNECTPDNPGRCEFGDLTGKLGTFSVPATVGDVSGKNFWTDSRLSLSGANSVSSRSIVIHAPNRGAPRLACADLLDVPIIKAKAGTWTSGSVMGNVLLTQPYETDLTVVDTSLQGLRDQASGWHIHNLPVPYQNNEPCSATSVQGHYNPFNIETSPSDGTFDMYEVGDLSGKFTSFAGLTEYIETTPDTNLYLYGPRSVVGRSIVIHNDDGSRWVCATLESQVPENAYTLIASANFTSAKMSGQVKFIQIYYGDEIFGETTIELEISSSSTDDTVMVDIRTGDEGESCSSGQVFNPYGVNTRANYDSDCDLRSQLRCQVGDLVGKHGEFSTSKSTVFTDINLPLAGRGSVLGYSLLFKSSGDDYFCANIEPLPDQGIALTYAFPSEVQYESYEFRTTLSEKLTEVYFWNIVSTRKPVISPVKDGCQSITFYLIGPNVMNMRNNFENAANFQDDGLGKYSPTDNCVAFVDFISATYTFGESEGTVTLVVANTGGRSATITLDFEDVNAEKGTDYSTTEDYVIEIPAGFIKEVTVSIINDQLAEVDETFDVSLMAPDGTVKKTTVTITDDDNIITSVTALRLDQPFEPELSNPNSAAYKLLAQSIEFAVESSQENVKASVTGFRSGSVIADVRMELPVLVGTVVDNSVVSQAEQILERNIVAAIQEDGSAFTSLPVDPSSVQISQPRGDCPCYNGGTCEPKDDSYICKCLEGYQGASCKTVFGPCQNWMCYNGATCKTINDAPFCACAPGFEGPDCKKAITTRPPPTTTIKATTIGVITDEPGLQNREIIILSFAGLICLLLVVVETLALLYVCQRRKTRLTQLQSRRQSRTAEAMAGPFTPGPNMMQLDSRRRSSNAVAIAGPFAPSRNRMPNGANMMFGQGNADPYNLQWNV